MEEKRREKSRAAYAMSLGRRTARLGKGRVGVAHASGRKSELLAAAAALGACEAGMDVIEMGEASRPLFHFGLAIASCRCGIYVSGNLEPVLQTVGEWGLPLSRLEEHLLRSCSGEVSVGEPGSRKDIPGLWELYCSRLGQIAGNSLVGSSCILRCGDPVLQQQAWSVLSALGCQLLKGPVLWLNNTGERLAAFSPGEGIIPFPQLVHRACKICVEQGKTVALPEGMLPEADQQQIILRYSLRPGVVTENQRAARELSARQLWERDGLMLAILLLKHQQQGSLEFSARQKMRKGDPFDFLALS